MHRLGRALENLLSRSAVWSYRRPYVALGCALLITIAFGLGVTRIKINADLAALLPERFPSVQALHDLERRYGAVGYVTILGEHAEPDQLRAFARDVAQRLEREPDFRYVDYRRPTEFFETHALYYLSVDDLEDLATKLEDRRAYEQRHANPLYVDLEDDGPPELSSEDVEGNYATPGSSTTWMTHQLGGDYYLDPQKQMIAVLARPALLGLDLNASKAIIETTHAVLGAMDLRRYGPDFTYEIAGSYQKKVDQQATVERDLGWANLVSLVLIIVFLAFHFRRISAVALLLAPLLVGTLWSYGFAGWSFGVLNILTSFVGAILSGMGIENGIHLLGRFETEWWLSGDREENVRRTFGSTGRGVAITVLTTVVAFIGVALSRFRAFHEFGIIAAVGMLLFLLAYQLLLPALIRLAVDRGWTPGQARHSGVPTFVRWLTRHARPVFLSTMAAFLVFTVGLPKTHFNFDLRSLLASDLRSYALDAEIDGLIGYSQTPVVMLTSSFADEARVAAELRARAEQRGDASTVRFIASSADLTPPGQAEKRAIIQQISTTLERIPRSRLGDAEQKKYDRAVKMSRAQPFNRDDLPVEVRRQFDGVRSNGEASGFVLVYATKDLSDGAFNRRLAREIRGVKGADGAYVPAAGESMLLADIADALATEAVPVVGFSVIFVFFTLWLFIGSLRSALICMAIAGGSLLATLGCMVFARMSLNYINVIMIPMFFGIGIDGGAHLLSRVNAAEGVEPVFAETGRAVTGSLVSNALGFLALVVAHHSGLRSLGTMALLGLAMNLVACNLALPAFVAWRIARWRAREQPVRGRRHEEQADTRRQRSHGEGPAAHREGRAGRAPGRARHQDRNLGR